MTKKKKIRQERAHKIVRILNDLYPNPETELNFSNNIELLIAVILSAQCTDKRVNEVTQDLFVKYRTLDDYADAKQTELEQDIRPTGFYRNKAKNIIGAAQTIREDFNGKLPKTMQEMLTIPGVARKTANVVLGIAYGIYPGIAVDTHVRRLAIKLDLTDETNPEKIEQDLLEIFPQKDWKNLNHQLVLYGRYICKAHKHACDDHPLTRIYPKAATIWPKSK